MGLCESCCGRGLKYEALDSNHKRSTAPGSGNCQPQQANAARANAVAKPASQLIAAGNGSAKAQAASVLPADAAATATGNRAGTTASAAAATVAGGSKPSVLAAAAAGGAARASVKGYGTAQAGYQPNGAATTSTAPAMRSAGPRAHYGYQQPQAAYQQQNYQYRPGARPAGSAYSAMATGYAGGRAAPSGAGVAASTFMRSAQPGAGGRGMPGMGAAATQQAGTSGNGAVVGGGFNAKYEVKEVLGVGSTSTCYRCLDRSTGQAFACKLIDKRAVEQKFKGLLEQFHNEISVLRQLRHPHIIFLKDAFETETRIHMVLEIMEGGELFDFVVNRGTLSEAEAARMLRGVASALAYMHSMGIIHRDLKPENLLISKDASTVKIIDFGLCKALEENAQAKSFLGTRGYLAPEMLQRESYSKAVDVWALGVICFVLLCGCLPFDDDSSRINRKSAMAKFVLRFPRWAQNLSPHAKDLLGGLLDVNPATRLTAQAALDHPWLSGAVAAATNMLESPKALRQQLPRIRSPQAQAMRYATPSAGKADGTIAEGFAAAAAAALGGSAHRSSGRLSNPQLQGGAAPAPTNQRQADFEEQREEYSAGARRPRKNSI